jgi:hypothetical protein
MRGTQLDRWPAFIEQDLAVRLGLTVAAAGRHVRVSTDVDADRCHLDLRF